MAKRVSIVIRTKDRPILLRRALDTVLGQTNRYWMLVIVNDGGCAADVEAVLAPYQPLFKERLTLIHNSVSLGMEAAANIGIRAGTGEFAVLLDDDDTWHPEFLDEAVAVLTDAGNAWMGGVACHVKRIDERIENGIALFEGETELNSWMRVVRLDRILTEKAIPPCAFVFRRMVLEEVGEYNESLKALGHWEFLIRFLLVAEIGVIEKFLTFHHRRTNLQYSPYENRSNSDVCFDEDVFIQNNAFRKYYSDPSQPIGLMMSVNSRVSGIIQAIGNLQRDFIDLRQQTASYEHLLQKVTLYDQLVEKITALEQSVHHLNKHYAELFRQQQNCLIRMEEHLFNLAKRYHEHAGLLESRVSKIDEIHLWLGMLTCPLRVIWRPLRALFVRGH